VVFNRLPAVPEDAFAGTPEPDNAYARMETHALWLSWLASLACPVLNRSSARGLCAPDVGEAEWLVRAARAGLPTRRSRLCSRARSLRSSELDGLELVASPGWPWFEAGGVVPLGPAPGLYMEPVDHARMRSTVVVGEALVGPHAREWGPGLHALARGVACDLLEVSAAPLAGAAPDDPAAWRVCGATAFPQRREPELVRAIADELESRARAGAEVRS
jgi:hypothetical protein